MINLDSVAQVGIAFTGMTAVWLAMGRSPKWAPIFGLVGEPFWFWTSIQHKQWGIVVLAVFYTLAWARGIKTYWMVPRDFDTATMRLSTTFTRFSESDIRDDKPLEPFGGP